MAFSAIRNLMCPLEAIYSMKQKLHRQKNHGDDNSKRPKKTARFDMGQYLHLTKPGKISLPSGLSASLKSRLRKLDPRAVNLKSFYSCFSRSKHQPPAAPPNTPDLTFDTTASAASPINALPPAILIQIFANLPTSTLPSLLRVNKNFGAIVVAFYDFIMNYPYIITSKYEFFPLTLPFPPWFALSSAYPHLDRDFIMDFYNAWWRVTIYEDCYTVLSPVLANEYVSYWSAASRRNPLLSETYSSIQSIGYEELENTIMKELVKHSFKRRTHVRGGVIEHLNKLVGKDLNVLDETVDGESIAMSDRECAGYSFDTESLYRELTAIIGGDSYGMLDTSESISATSSDSQTPMLSQALACSIHPTIREELEYTFPEVEVERLHPVQLLELLRIRVPPWSWRQENQVGELKRLFLMSDGSRTEMEGYRAWWEEMRSVIGGVIAAGGL
ncbi:hypothetical protein TWF481_004977 [Arthrobotrys musiformis]|uniref:F-box domain-containing protein n=1 Tax=Arthrobotrys musiformis TaxID=47236 RepID=A0AAV9WLI6_9PEZI